MLYEHCGEHLSVTKGTSPSPNGLGYPRIPGLFSPEQTESWKVVTDVVHSEGGRIFLQLMHAGWCGVAGAVDGGHERHGLDRQPGGGALWLASEIFAFTLALFMIFWFAGNFPPKLEALEKSALTFATQHMQII